MLDTELAGHRLAAPRARRRMRTPPVLALAACLAAAAGALSPAGAQGPIESICQSWNEGPCVTRVAASVRSATTGRPLAGKSLRFVAGDAVICSSVTDASGAAACFGVAPSGRELAEHGYRIVFEGDERFASETVHAGVAVRRASYRDEL